VSIIIVTYSRYAWHSLPRQRWRNKRCRCYGNGQVNTPPLPSPRWHGSDSHCEGTRDTAVDWDNRQKATGNRHRYKKPAEQHVELVSIKSHRRECVTSSDKERVVRRFYVTVRDNWSIQKVKIYCVSSRFCVSTVVQLYWECVIHRDWNNSRVVNTWRLLRTEWTDLWVGFVKCVNP
jgi:hypothetical protein